MRAAVLTISDGVAAGEREDESGVLLVELLELSSARVLALAGRHPVGDREHRRLHDFVFSTSFTSSTTIPLSIAFAMS